jgi:hypothetical protein
MRQFSLALDRPRSTATDDALVCAFGTPWLDHGHAPFGTGRGCPSCEQVGFPVAHGIETQVQTGGFWSQVCAAVRQSSTHG